MNQPRKGFWFPAKRYGWGWGLPNSWQGWIVLLVFLVVVGAIPYFAPPRADPLLFYGLLALAMIALMVVFWLKGEPPRWRWGDSPKSK